MGKKLFFCSLLTNWVDGNDCDILTDLSRSIYLTLFSPQSDPEIQELNSIRSSQLVARMKSQFQANSKVSMKALTLIFDFKRHASACQGLDI